MLKNNLKALIGLTLYKGGTNSAFINPLSNMIMEEKSWQQNITANISGVCFVCCILHSRELKENKTLSVLDG